MGLGLQAIGPNGNARAQHGFFAEALWAHFPTLAMWAGFGTNSGSWGIVRFVQGGVVKTIRCTTSTNKRSRGF